jgi:RHS repeat-associated protein
MIYEAGGKTLKNIYAYDKDNLLTSYTMPTNKTVTYSYDEINRNNNITIGTTTPITISYMYWLSAADNSYRTNRIQRETIDGVKHDYVYDKNGNITLISELDTQSSIWIPKIKYYYDALNQLVREDNVYLNKTIAYSYNAGGNMTSKKEYAYTTGTLGTPVRTISYGYDTTWKDKLTTYNGGAITYDEIGNPLSFNGYTLTWENGRQLAGMTGNGSTIAYKYDENGTRTEKTVNGVTSKYQYVEGNLQYEQKGSAKLYYFYSGNGQASGVKYINASGTEANYYFTYNWRGDIIGIYTEAGTLVAKYLYDSWGKLVSVTDQNGNAITDMNHIGNMNSLRYRGYYYDTENGLYYLQSRYYNPEWGRFINADVLLGEPGELLGHNMFAYCENNSVNFVDPTGYKLMYEIAGVSGGSGGYVPPGSLSKAIKYAIKKVGKVIKKAKGVIGWSAGRIGKAKTIEDVLEGASETTNGKGVARNFEKSGGFEKTLEDFNSLRPTDVKDIQTKYGPGKVGKLSDGTTVVARPGSKTSGPTLEITVSNSKAYKIRY